MKERIFAEAEAVGADFIRVDVEMSAIFEGPAAPSATSLTGRASTICWSCAASTTCGCSACCSARPPTSPPVPSAGPTPGRCAAADTEEFGRLAGEIAEHAKDTIRHWEVVNEPDGDWAFEGTPEQYAAMLSAAHDGIKARVPDARMVLGGIQRPRRAGAGSSESSPRPARTRSTSSTSRTCTSAGRSRPW